MSQANGVVNQILVGLSRTRTYRDDMQNTTSPNLLPVFFSFQPKDSTEENSNHGPQTHTEKARRGLNAHKHTEQQHQSFKTSSSPHNGTLWLLLLRPLSITNAQTHTNTNIDTNTNREKDNQYISWQRRTTETVVVASRR